MHLGTCQSCLISTCRYFSTRLAIHMYSITSAHCERNELAYCVKCNAVVCCKFIALPNASSVFGFKISQYFINTKMRQGEFCYVSTN